MSNDDIAALIKTLRKGKDFIERGQAAEDLGEIRDGKVETALIKALKKDLSEDVRARCAVSLAKMGAKQSIPDLLKGAMRESRPFALETYYVDSILKLSAGKADFDLLWVLRKHRKPRARSFAAYVLGKTGAREAIPPLCHALQQDKYPSVRQDIIHALMRIGGDQAVPALSEAMLGDSSEKVRSAAEYALDELGYEEHALAEILAAVTCGGSSEKRGNAVEMLRLKRDPAVVPILVDAVSDPDSSVRQKAGALLLKASWLETLPALRKAREKGIAEKALLDDLIAKIKKKRLDDIEGASQKKLDDLIAKIT